MNRAGTLILIIIAFTLPTSTRAQTFVSGPVSGTWTAGGNSYVVLSPGVTVPSPAALTIEAGVVVQFESGASLTASGPLRVNGVSGSEVVFQAATQPGAAGDWEGLRLNHGSHVVRHANFSDAANTIDNGLAGPSDLTVESCTFSCSMSFCPSSGPTSRRTSWASDESWRSCRS